MKRFIYRTIQNWFSEGGNLLIIDGAPSVGKTTMIYDYLISEDITYSYIDLNEEDISSIENLFLTSNRCIVIDHLNGDKKLLKSLNDNAKSYPDKKIIVIDTFIKESRDVISIGKVNYMTLKPLSFEEFLFNTSQDIYSDLTTLEDVFSIPETLHSKIMDKFVDYLFVGGYPSVVKTYMDSGLDHELIRKEQNRIVEWLNNRLLKYYDKVYCRNFTKIISLIIKSLNRENKKFRVSDISGSTRYNSFKKYIQSLINLHIISGSKLLSGTEMNVDEKKSVLYFIDTGLLGAINNLPDIFYNKESLLQENTSLSLVLNSISMQISALDKGVEHLHWLKNMSKIEFVLRKGNNILPIEVKDDSSGKLKSLDTLVEYYEDIPLIRLNLLPPETKGQISTYPLYLVNSVLRKYLN